MLIYVQKFLEECCQNGKKMIVFSLQGRVGVWYSGHFLLFSILYTFLFHQYYNLEGRKKIKTPQTLKEQRDSESRVFKRCSVEEEEKKEHNGSESPHNQPGVTDNKNTSSETGGWLCFFCRDPTGGISEYSEYSRIE